MHTVACTSHRSFFCCDWKIKYFLFHSGVQLRVKLREKEREGFGIIEVMPCFYVSTAVALDNKRISYWTLLVLCLVFQPFFNRHQSRKKNYQARATKKKCNYLRTVYFYRRGIIFSCTKFRWYQEHTRKEALIWQNIFGSLQLLVFLCCCYDSHHSCARHLLTASSALSTLASRSALSSWSSFKRVRSFCKCITVGLRQWHLFNYKQYSSCCTYWPMWHKRQ